jgi:hypothetical protein
MKIRDNIIELLTNTKKNWEKYISSNDDNDIKVLLFQDFKETAGEILLFINKALNSEENLSDYQLLDKQWGNEYNINRDYLGSWLTLRNYLQEWEEKNNRLIFLNNLSQLNEKHFSYQKNN